MLLIRRVTQKDTDAIHALALASGTGITTLPKKMELISARIRHNEVFWQENVHTQENAYYWFVAEDTESARVVGTSAIEAYAGYDLPFYSYKISKRNRHSSDIQIESEYHLLNLVNDYKGKTELCTLFLHPDYRHSKQGQLLSKARFLYMANFPTRFHDIVFAEMRGVSDAKGQSPFWNALGAHFFKLPFDEADKLTGSTKQFIADLMPEQPVYVELLPKDAQEVIGKPHPGTEPAMRILEEEGFRPTTYVDIFDAGPTIEARQQDIRSIAQSRVYKLKSVSDEAIGSPSIIANQSWDFRAVSAPYILNLKQGSCVLSKMVAEYLQVKPGEYIRIADI